MAITVNLREDIEWIFMSTSPRFGLSLRHRWYMQRRFCKKNFPCINLETYIKCLPNGYMVRYVVSNFCSEILPGCIFNFKSKHFRVLLNNFGKNSFLNLLIFFRGNLLIFTVKYSPQRSCPSWKSLKWLHICNLTFFLYYS